MKRRKQSGVHAIELVGGLMFLVPIVLYGLDYATVVYAGSMNANLCQAACRAAAQGPPTGIGNDQNNTPKARAAAVISRMSQANGLVKVKKTVRCAEFCRQPLPTAPYGGPVFGKVIIKTRCDVYPPFALPFVDKHAVLYSTAEYPWTYVMAADYSGSSGGDNWQNMMKKPSNGATGPGSGGGKNLQGTLNEPGGGLDKLSVGGGSGSSGGSGGSGGSGPGPTYDDMNLPIMDSDP